MIQFIREAKSCASTTVAELSRRRSQREFELGTKPERRWIDSDWRSAPMNSFDNSLIDCRRRPNKDANLRCWLWSHSFSKQFYKIILWSNFEQLRWLAEEKNFKFSNEEFKRLRWANQKEPQKDELLCWDSQLAAWALHSKVWSFSLSLSLWPGKRIPRD